MNALPIPAVLVIDDDDLMRTLIEIALEDDCRLILTASGEEALSWVATAQEAPDLILLDVGLPGIDGFETCCRLRQFPRLANTPIVFVSGDNDEPSRRAAAAAGGVGYLTKPFDPDQLRALIVPALRP